MAAGQGFKTFATGDVLTAADTNGYLMQGVWVFADAAARTAAVTSPQEGNMSYLKDTNSTEYYSGSAWVAVAPTASGGMTLLSTTSLSGATTTISSISGSYNQLFVEVLDYYVSSPYPLLLRFNSDATANAYQGSYDYYPSDATAGQRAPFVAKDTNYYLNYGSVGNTDSNNYASMTFQNYSLTTVRKTLSSNAIYTNSGGNVTVENSGGGWLNSAAISSISFITSGGTFSGGSVKIWGIK